MSSQEKEKKNRKLKRKRSKKTESRQSWPSISRILKPFNDFPWLSPSKKHHEQEIEHQKPRPKSKRKRSKKTESRQSWLSISRILQLWLSIPRILQLFNDFPWLGPSKKHHKEIEQLQTKIRHLVEELNTTKDGKERLEKVLDQIDKQQTAGDRHSKKLALRSLGHEEKTTVSQLPSEIEPVGARWTLRIPQGSRDDDYFEKQFRDLKSRTREWVVLGFIVRRDSSKMPSFDSLDPPLRDLISRLGFDDATLQDEYRTQDMIQAIVADKLREEVLSRFLGGFGEPEEETCFRSFLDKWNKPEKFPSIIKCKMSIAEVIAPSESVRLALPQSVREKIRNLVQLLEPLAADPSFNVNKRTKSLQRIFEIAAMLVVELRKQPHEFSVPSIELGKEFDENMMEAEEPEDKNEISDAPGQIVTGVIFPPLQRAGLESILPRVIVKASVLVKGCESCMPTRSV